jgi:hypothetical protein
MENKKLKLGLAALGLLLICGCGIKGPPLPPIETIEAETINSKALQVTSVSATTQTTPANQDKTKSKK